MYKDDESELIDKVISFKFKSSVISSPSEIGMQIGVVISPDISIFFITKRFKLYVCNVLHMLPLGSVDFRTIRILPNEYSIVWKLENENELRSKPSF